MIKCSCFDCIKEAVWFNITRKGNINTPKYCDGCYHTWAIPQDIGRFGQWKNINNIEDNEIIQKLLDERKLVQRNYNSDDIKELLRKHLGSEKQ